MVTEWTCEVVAAMETQGVLLLILLLVLCAVSTCWGQQSNVNLVL